MTDPRPLPTPDAQPTADAPLLPTNWGEFVESQQRWWSEWLEAGQIWSSWWFSQIPPVNWPPVGEVLPPASDHAISLPEGQRHAASMAGQPAHLAKAPQRPSRARSARHQ